MNYYPFHIGDYAKKTRHLSWDEDMAYRRLMDVYYLKEGPLPSDKASIYRLVMASSKVQRAAVDVVLKEFFVLAEGGFSNDRCDEELSRWKEKEKKATSSANARWKNADAMRTQCEGNANAMRSQCERNANHNHNHNQEPDKKEDGIGTRAREPRADLETKLREAAGWQSEPAPMLAVTGAVQSIIDSGASLDLDVLPAVRALAPSARSRTSWKYFLSAIAQARDDRIAASKIISTPLPNRGFSNGPTQQTPSLSPRQAAIAKLKQRAIDAKLREISESGDSGGPDIQGPSGDADGKSRLSGRPH